MAGGDGAHFVLYYAVQTDNSLLLAIIMSKIYIICRVIDS